MGEVHVDEDDNSVVVCYTDEATSAEIEAALRPYLDRKAFEDGQLTHDPNEGVWTVVLRKPTGRREINAADLPDLPDGKRVEDAAGNTWLLMTDEEWREPLFARYGQEDGKIVMSPFTGLPSPVTVAS